jgi:hypothetical protein
MRTFPFAKLSFAVLSLAFFSIAGIAAQAATSIPIRKPLIQVNLKTNEAYYVDGFKADIDRLETGLSSASGQNVKLPSKDRLNILLDTIDMMLFRQFCDREGLKVSDADVNNQIAQFKASLGSGATDAAVEMSLRRNGVFTDVKTYFRQDLLFGTYLKQKKGDQMKAISQPSVSDILKSYDDMKFSLRRPTSYRFTMLLSRTQGKSDADKKKAADTMRAIAAKSKADPSAFDEYFVRGAVDSKNAGFQTMPNLVIAKTAESKKQYPNLSEAIFKLKEGEASDCIEEEQGYCVVRVSAYLPEKQLGLDDLIEGLTSTKAAAANPTATVMALVVNDYQSSKFSALQKSTHEEVSAKLRKEGTITVSLAGLNGILEQPEIDAVKALKGSGYTIILQ